jgi:phytoene/squalene synthetase
LQQQKLNKNLSKMTFSSLSSPPPIKPLNITTITTNSPSQAHPNLPKPSEQHAPLVTTTITDPGAITFESALNEAMIEVKRNTPYVSAQINLFPSKLRPLAYGLRSLVCELDAIPEKSSKPDIIMLKATFWRSSAEKMRSYIIHEMLSQSHGPNSPEMMAFLRTAQSVDPPPPLAPIKTMTHAIAHEGLGFDFILLDNMITHHADYFQGNVFADLPEYIKTVDQTTGNLNLLLITNAAHEIQRLQTVQPLSKPIMNAAIQLGRVEGLFRLLSQQPITFANNHTWLPRDLLRQNGVDPAHFATVGKELLQYSNKEWFDGFGKNQIPNLKIRADISHEFQDFSGEESLERDLHFMRSSDPERSKEGLNSTIPKHLQNIETITMSTLRTGLRETNKVIYNVATEQLKKLRTMQGDIPKQLRPYFFQTYAIETYLDALKEKDFDTLDPELHVWAPKQMLKLNAKMLWGNTINKF